jgi:DMSO/TMAO reductase YedYZ molybdopterin-dependent catalytic subunit
MNRRSSLRMILGITFVSMLMLASVTVYAAAVTATPAGTNTPTATLPVTSTTTPTLSQGITPPFAATPQATSTTEAKTNSTLTPGASATPCVLPTVAVPTLPAEIPGYAQLDPATGLHVTGSAPEIDLASYRLKVTGKVGHPLSLAYDELRCMPKVQVHCTLVCPGFFEDEATWAGVPLTYVLDLAGVQTDASVLTLKSADGYANQVSLTVARKPEALLAYEWEGQPLPILHGFPVRAVFPDVEGNKWVKWLVEIEVE